MSAADKLTTSECLSAPHDNLVHFSRCVKFGARQKYLENAPAEVRGQIDHLLSRVEDVRFHIEARPDGEFWTGRLADHLSDLRAKPQPRKHDRSLAEATLSVLHLGSHSSHTGPEETRPPLPGAAAAAAVGPGASLDGALSVPNGQPYGSPQNGHVHGSNAQNHAHSHLHMHGAHTHGSANGNANGHANGKSKNSAKDSDSHYKGLHAGAVFFKDGFPHSHSKLEGTFPHQNMPLVDLLSKDKDRNVLMEECDEGIIRWFHIPANNMAWVEEVIARHYNEDRPPRNELFERAKGGSKTQEILRRVNWRGHSREAINPHIAPHNRQLEPSCEIVKTGTTTAMALFAPFLHWDTEQGWQRQQKAILDATRVANMQTATSAPKDRVQDNFNNELRGHHVQSTTLSSLAHEAISSSSSHLRSMTTRAASRRGVVGRVLFCAARIFKLMASFEDDELVREYLFANPPLHPRRSLHQTFTKYSSFLLETETLDREQIVYKATAPVTTPASRPNCNKWCQCSDCKKERAAVPRLLMVDQLWLFVLDENTIITSFPQRWGSWFSDDPSGVHKRVCERLQGNGNQDVSTPYELALTIYDVCCRVFYESTTYLDRQPQMNFIFADSLNFVTTRELAARQQLSNLAQDIWTAYGSPDKAGIAEAHREMLNINPEAGLMRQVDNILSDLKVIRQIKVVQQEVLEQYHVNVARQLLPQFSHAGPELHTPRLRDVRRMRDALVDDETIPMLKRSAATWTLAQADDFEDLFADQFRQIDKLYGAAEYCAKRLEELLETKSRYAGIISAWEAVASNVEITNQGRSIMLFSVLSIIFLPLSFIASLFGMNSMDYENGLASFASELGYIFGISILVIFLALLLAFDKFSLALLLYGLKVPTKWLSTRVAIYEPPVLQRSRNYRKLNEKRVRKIRAMEEEIERARAVRDTKLFWKSVEDEQARRRETMRNKNSGRQHRVPSGNFDSFAAV